MDNSDPDTDTDDDASSSMTIAVPGLELAAEYAVNDWLTLRGSAGYGWAVQMDSVEATKADTTSMTDGGGLTWAVGAGANFGALSIDAHLQNGFLVNGPDFISGAGPGLAQTTSLTYKF